MKSQFDYLLRSYPLEVTRSGKSFQVSLADQSVEAEPLPIEPGRLDLLLNGRRVTAYISIDGDQRWVTVNGQTVLLTRSSGSTGPRKGKAGGARAEPNGVLTAPMPGQVRLVNVVEGEPVAKGQTLLVLEAMKMEIRIQAPQAGRVKKLRVQQGQTVEREQILIEMDHP